MHKYKAKEWLQKMFEINGNKTQIAKICNVSDDTIEYWRKKFNIKKSNKGLQATRTHKLNQNYFEEIDTEHKAYWLGFIMADGCITRTSKNGAYNRLDICLKNSDIQILNDLQKDLESDYPIKIKNNINKKMDFETTICELRISSKKLVDDLIKNGISPNKTGKEILPKTIPKELVPHFIRGYFDGDGSITVNKSFRVCSSSQEILISFNDFFDNVLGFDFAIYEVKKYKVPFFVIDSNNNEKNKKVLDLIYKGSTIYLDRKYKRYVNMYCSSIW